MKLWVVGGICLEFLGIVFFLSESHFSIVFLESTNAEQRIMGR